MRFGRGGFDTGDSPVSPAAGQRHARPAT